MRWGLCTIAFRDDDVREVIDRAARLGFDEVEIIGKQVEEKTDAQLDAIKKTAEEAGMGISGLSPYFWLTQNAELLEHSISTAERFVAIARRLGAGMIRTFTDAGPTGIGSHEATEEHWAVAVQALQTMTAMAPEITFAVETHHNTLADTPESVESLLHRVDAPNLKILYQPLSRKGVVGDFLRFEPLVRQIHLNPHLGPDPEAGLACCGYDYGALLECLGQRGYPHSCALEFCVPGTGSWEEIGTALAWCKQRSRRGR